MSLCLCVQCGKSTGHSISEDRFNVRVTCSEKCFNHYSARLALDGHVLYATEANTVNFLHCETWAPEDEVGLLIFLVRWE